MTTAQAKAIYIAAGGPKDHSDNEWKDIHKEIEAMTSAKTDRAAAKIIRWWDCWNSKDTAISFARRVRQIKPPND
jgi:hypothetical protein